VKNDIDVLDGCLIMLDIADKNVVAWRQSPFVCCKGAFDILETTIHEVANKTCTIQTGH